METKQEKKKVLESGVLCYNKNTNVGQVCVSFVCEIKETSILNFTLLDSFVCGNVVRH